MPNDELGWCLPLQVVGLLISDLCGLVGRAVQHGMPTDPNELDQWAVHVQRAAQVADHLGRSVENAAAPEGVFQLIGPPSTIEAEAFVGRADLRWALDALNWGAVMHITKWRDRWGRHDEENRLCLHDTMELLDSEYGINLLTVGE